MFTTLQHAMDRPPHGPRKKKTDRLPEIDNADRLIISGSINPAAFSVTSGNPNPGTIKGIFDSLGFTDIFGTIRNEFEVKWGKPESYSFIPDKLSEIVDRRHVVAHTANALNIIRTDLREAVRFLKILAELLDPHLKTHVEEILDT